MTTDPLTTLLQLTRAAALFDQIADGLIAGVRRAMSVPSPADPDIEQEFAFLRGSLDAFFPEFRQLFGGLVLKYVGEEHLPGVLDALRSELAQRYLLAAPRIDAELQQHLGRLSQEMLLAAQAALGLAGAEAEPKT
jgi:hypothetical protein